MVELSVVEVMKDLLVIEPKTYKDSRGYFMERYNQRDFKAAGIETDYVQINESYSKQGVLRGLHYQSQYPQGKLVSVVWGQVYDVAVDLRADSPTYLQHYGIILSSKNKKQMYIPPGFAHGFLVLSEYAKFIYHCTQYYHSEDQRGIIWNDKILNIDWPITNEQLLNISAQDKSWPSYEAADVL